MPPLPPVPNFELDASDGEPEGSAQQAVPPPPPDVEQESQVVPVPASVRKPTSVGDVQATVADGAGPSVVATSEASPLQGGSGLEESVDEVLHQASAQALQIVNLGEQVGTINQGLDEFREEMLATQIQMRALLAEQVQRLDQFGGTQPASLGGETITQRLDAVELQSHSVVQRSRWLLVMASVQTVLLVIALIVLLAGRSDPPPASAAPAAATQESQLSPPAAPKAPAKEPRRSKRKRRQRR